MNTERFRVVKLGGSLLEFDELVPRLRGWLDRQHDARSVLIVGGGAAADLVRQAQRLHHLDDTTAHWLAIDAMSFNTRLVAALFPEAALVNSLDAIASVKSASPSLFDPKPFLVAIEPQLPGVKLPVGWQTTSDSIAARIAKVLHADELVLLKSALPEEPCTLSTAAERGYVDPHFPHAAAELTIRFVNLRRPAFPEQEVP